MKPHTRFFNHIGAALCAGHGMRTRVRDIAGERSTANQHYMRDTTGKKSLVAFGASPERARSTSPPPSESTPETYFWLHIAYCALHIARGKHNLLLLQYNAHRLFSLQWKRGERTPEIPRRSSGTVADREKKKKTIYAGSILPDKQPTGREKKRENCERNPQRREESSTRPSLAANPGLRVKHCSSDS